MKAPEGYRIYRQLHRSNDCRISRAVRLKDGRDVVIKQLNRNQCSRDRLSRFQHEYDILSRLRIRGIMEPLDLLTLESGPAAIYIDSGSLPLRQLIVEQKLEWPQWLAIAIRISNLLGRLHEAGITHKQISPDHLLLNPDTGMVELIGFSRSTGLSREQANWHTPDLSQEGLAYIAPEQTGRINRSIDYRSDYYSLGASLYEMMTGRPPFMGDDGMALVHDHIAKQPGSPHQLNPQLPEILSRVILKLLSKDAAQRYQSSVGLIHDLQQCLQAHQRHQHDFTFQPGQQDLSARFQMPQRLYGREPLLQQLRQQYDRCCRSESPLVLITGYAGVGKTSLVYELRQYVNEQGGSFSGGKFDQFRRNRPYYAIFQALQGLVRQLLTEPEERIERWRQQLLDSIGSQAQVLLKLIPELELIIGSQPDLPPLPPADEQSRFSRLFTQMLRVLASPKRPLVLFLDDLHWADLASLHLIETLVNVSAPPGLMLIGSYRDHELSATHPLRTLLERLQQNPQPPLELALQPLELTEVNQLIADTLKVERTTCHGLARACMAKTQGNPFFLSQFLHALHQDGLISFREQRWQWDEDAIHSQEMTDNVIELMVNKIQRLPLATQKVLPLAACIGSHFNLRTLSVVSGHPPRDVTDRLWPAMSEGLIVPQDDSYRLFQNIEPERTRFRFVHDRVQQAAYSLIADTALEQLHLQIGRQLEQSLKPDEIDSRIFEISNHLNQAQKLLQHDDERLQLARLNLRAGIRARESAAFDSALDYLNTGLSLLPSQCWQRDYTLALELHTAAADIANIKGKHEQMLALIRTVEAHASRLLDRIRVYQILIQSQVANNEFKQALQTAQLALQQLGVNMPAIPGRGQLTYAVTRTQWLLRRMPPEKILQLPAMEDPQLLAAMPILASMFGAIKFSSSELRPLVMARQVELTLKHGLSPLAALAFAGYGGVLCGQFNAIDQGYRLGKLALQLDEQNLSTLTHHRTLTLFDCYIRHYREPLKHCMESLLNAHQLALDAGDMEWSAYALAAYIQYVFPLCRNLDELQPKLEQYAKLLAESGQQQSLQYSQFVLQTMENLRGQCADPTRFDGRFYHEERNLAELKRENHRTAISLHHFYKSLLCYLFNQPAEAYRHSEAGMALRASISGTLTVPWLQLINALSILALLPQTHILQQPARLKKVHQTLRYLRKLARFSPENHRHHADLLQAELYRRRHQYTRAMDLYEQAIEHARQQGFVLDEAMVSELAGQFYLDWDKPGIARTYLQDAYERYADWGGRAKLEQMQQQYPFTLERSLRHLDDPHPQDNASGGLPLDNRAFDINSVIHASQAISDEIVLERLLERLMQLALQNAGAQRAILIMRRAQELFLEAEICLNQAPRIFNARPLEHSEALLPLSIIHYVARTKDDVVLGNATEHQMFQQDSYIRQHQPRSLLAMPILYHGELTAILYLEHSESRDIFNRDRLKTLQMLASQAAISIENAKLYQSLAQSEREYRSLFENSSEGIFRIDRRGHFISANPALVKLLGYASAGQFLGTVTDVIRDCFVDRKECHQFLAQLNRHERVLGFETRWHRQDGSEVFISISAHCITDEQQMLTYYEGSLTDISERKAKEKAELAREKAEAASEAKSQFLATMSHEIRTPMNGILGMAQLLMRSELGAHQHQQVDSIYRSGQSLLSILNDVLDFTKIEAGQMELEQTEFSLHELLEQLKQLLIPMAQEKQLDLILRPDPALPDRLLGDPRALNQVLLNLCTNALKFTAEGYVLIKARLLADQGDGRCHIHFEVEDSGIGIPLAAHPRIFMHFSQADSSITRRFGGTGLGLSICKRLVELQGGEVGFDSRPGEGSRFWAELAYPVMEHATAASTAATPLVATQRSQRLDILLVEDTPINQQVTVGLLESEGHSVSVADDGYTALSMHNDHAYDLVLMDIHLPDMDGIETTQRMRQHSDPSRAQVRIIALTASVTPTEIRRYQHAGMDAVVSKPLQFDELNRLLRQHPPVNGADLVGPAPPAALLNTTLLNQHLCMLGQERFHGLCQQMNIQCLDLLQELEQAAPSEQVPLLHKLGGTLSNFGMQQAAELSRQLEQQSHCSEAELDRLIPLCRSSLNELQARFAHQRP
ncbi:PAS domain S-box-containing protein [Marinobacterium halophilum]|uniref:histidine kinase n=1 Tax=Marinobacterium halophilum TaxID=267374 RepID=A0A2P8EQJ1_9GAMM|nr:AAA family ATPase [Marinobacterium halophilum]PSL11731.1 PAS domain S-box-containing protein [Marinobacterium halophilum]